MKDEMMRQIQAVSFAMDDLRLFLDTHPSCSQAMELFNKYALERKELIARYNSEVSPMCGYCPEETEGWRWVTNSAWKGGDH